MEFPGWELANNFKVFPTLLIVLSALKSKLTQTSPEYFLSDFISYLNCQGFDEMLHIASLDVSYVKL